MISGNEKPTRDWREIAAEAAKEKNEEKLYVLMDELERALDERDRLLWASGRSQKQREPRHPRFGQLADLRF
jgi:hypothetical protein